MRPITNGLQLATIILLFIATVNALQLFSSSGWTYVGSFTDSVDLLQSFEVYKPLCPGRYKLGDIVIEGTQYGTDAETTIASMLVCVDGLPDEIIEAGNVEIGFVDTDIVFTRVFHGTNSSLYSGPLGQVGLSREEYDSTTKETLVGTRGYGAFIHPNCTVLRGDNCLGTANTISPKAKVYLYNSLQAFQSGGGEIMFTQGGSLAAPVSSCLSTSCLCPKCVHGQCLFPTGGCACLPGWTGTNCDEDADECALNVDDCDSFATCINTSPGYLCECLPGYELQKTSGVCEDVDECLTANNCTDPLPQCTNIPGSFVCTDCEAGFIRLANGTCVEASTVFLCGNSQLDEGEQCDRGVGCNSGCQCNTGFSPQGNVSCIRLCGNGVLDANEQCDGGTGCLDITCQCDTNLGYVAVNETFCIVPVPVDACLRFSGNCSSCTARNCFYCGYTDTCTFTREGSDCLSTCPNTEEIIPVASPTSEDPVIGSGNLIVTVVPAVVVSSAVAIAGVVVLVVLLRRRRKRKGRSSISVSMKTSSNTSKYGIERNALSKTQYKSWEPQEDSEYVLVSKMPFELSKPIDFNMDNNQFKVGQKYTDHVIVTAKDKGKPVEIEVTMTMNMTTELDIDIGVECTSEKKHSFITFHLLAELSSFLDLEEIALEGGSSAKPVGDGAFGVVYKGKYRGQDVAVKMLKVQDMPEEMLDEFDREVDLMNKLRHKNIVQFIGASKVVGRFALVTEFIEGGNVSNAILTTKPVDFVLKVRFALDAARAMHFLHENRVLHRDLKLDNLLCVSTNPDDPVVAKLTDFGTSRAVSEKNSNQYTVGVGTPMYMSPEILAKKPYDTKSDVYSYGVMLWILFSQKEPYKHIEHSWEVARYVIEGNREKIPKDCPEEYRELIEQCWAQDPSARPDFQEIVDKLEKMLAKYSAMTGTLSNSKGTRKSVRY